MFYLYVIEKIKIKCVRRPPRLVIYVDRAKWYQDPNKRRVLSQTDFNLFPIRNLEICSEPRLIVDRTEDGKSRVTKSIPILGSESEKWPPRSTRY